MKPGSCGDNSHFPLPGLASSISEGPCARKVWLGPERSQLRGPRSTGPGTPARRRPRPPHTGSGGGWPERTSRARQSPRDAWLGPELRGLRPRVPGPVQGCEPRPLAPEGLGGQPLSRRGYVRAQEGPGGTELGRKEQRWVWRRHPGASSHPGPPLHRGGHAPGTAPPRSALRFLPPLLPPAPLGWSPRCPEGRQRPRSSPSPPAVAGSPAPSGTSWGLPFSGKRPLCVPGKRVGRALAAVGTAEEPLDAWAWGALRSSPEALGRAGRGRPWQSASRSQRSARLFLVLPFPAEHLERPLTPHTASSDLHVLLYTSEAKPFGNVNKHYFLPQQYVHSSAWVAQSGVSDS